MHDFNVNKWPPYWLSWATGWVGSPKPSNPATWLANNIQPSPRMLEFPNNLLSATLFLSMGILFYFHWWFWESLDMVSTPVWEYICHWFVCQKVAEVDYQYLWTIHNNSDWSQVREIEFEMTQGCCMSYNNCNNLISSFKAHRSSITGRWASSTETVISPDVSYSLRDGQWYRESISNTLWNCWKNCFNLEGSCSKISFSVTQSFTPLSNIAILRHFVNLFICGATLMHLSFNCWTFLFSNIFYWVNKDKLTKY